jgi:hypothetical protein
MSERASNISGVRRVAACCDRVSKTSAASEVPASSNPTSINPIPSTYWTFFMHPKPLPMVAADLPATAGPQHWSMNGRSACAAVAVHRREIGRYRLGIFLLSLFSILLSSCARVSTTGFLKGDTMGTFYTVQYWSDNTLEPQKLDTTIKNVLNEFENQLSNWRHDSWVNRFNASPAHKPIPVPEHAFNVIKLSLELAERTNGAFDPTLSPLIQLWGFGTKRRSLFLIRTTPPCSRRIPICSSIVQPLPRATPSTWSPRNCGNGVFKERWSISVARFTQPERKSMDLLGTWAYRKIRRAARS